MQLEDFIWCTQVHCHEQLFWIVVKHRREAAFSCGALLAASELHILDGIVV